MLGIRGGTTWCGEPGGTRAYTSCTVTSGGAPVPWTDDAVSSYSLRRAGSEVAVLELFSDGVDIFGLRLEKQLTRLKQNSAATLPSTNNLLLVTALVVLNNYTCALLPRLYRQNSCLGQLQKLTFLTASLVSSV